MLNRELFKKTIENIKEQEKIDIEVGKSLEKVCDSYVIFNSGNLYLSSLINILKETFKDENDWITWWLWETDDFNISVDGVETSVEDLDNFYDFLIEEKRINEEKK